MHAVCSPPRANLLKWHQHTAHGFTTRAAFLLAAAVLVATVATVPARPAAEDEEGADPDVAACRQQCARQRQFGAAERRQCVDRCDEYGRAKREAAEQEAAERERDRCVHECRVGPAKPGSERRCREAYDERTSRAGGGGPRGGAAGRGSAESQAATA